MAALGWLLNLGFAGGESFVARSRILEAATVDRSLEVAARIDCEIAAPDRSFTPEGDSDFVVPIPDRTFTPADD